MKKPKLMLTGLVRARRARGVKARARGVRARARGAVKRVQYRIQILEQFAVRI